MTLIAFADDLALVVMAKDEVLVNAGEVAVELARRWLDSKDLALAVDKTILVVLGG